MSLMKEIETSYVGESWNVILLNTQCTAFVFLPIHVLVEQVTNDNVLNFYLM